MILGTRDAAIFAELQNIFPEGIENQQPHSSLLAPAIIAKIIGQQLWESITYRLGSTHSVTQTE
jgi:hypothetical protein